MLPLQQTSQQQAVSCFVRVGDKRVLLREFVLELVLVLHSYNLRLVKVYNQ